jgi:hypothetical protein
LVPKECKRLAEVDFHRRGEAKFGIRVGKVYPSRYPSRVHMWRGGLFQ